MWSRFFLLLAGVLLGFHFVIRLLSYLGCPRNNQIFFRFKPKQTETQSVSVVFRFVSRTKNIFFGLFRCFGPVSKQTEFSRNKPNKSPKNVLYQGVLETINFFFLGSNQNKPNSICFGCFSVCFFAKPKNIFFGSFRFVLMFRAGIETTKTSRTYGMGN